MNSRIKRLGKTILTILLAIVIIYACQFLIGAIIGIGLTIAFGVERTMVIADHLLIQLFTTSASILATYIIIRFLLKRKASEFFLKDQKLLPRYSIGMVIALLMLGLFMAINLTSKQIQYQGSGGMGFLFIFLYFIGFTIQAFSEEFLVRGLMQKLLEEKHSAWLSIILPSAIFSLLHLANPDFNWLSMVNTFLIGLIFAYLTYLTRSLWMASGLHMLWNYLIGPVFGLPVSGIVFNESILKFVNLGEDGLLNGGLYGPEASLLVTILTVATLAILYGFRKKLEDKDYFPAKKIDSKKDTLTREARTRAKRSSDKG